MSDNFEEFCNTQAIQNRVCGVAYTLNNTQPVICTHIGDQPFFYIDEENIEDEELFDPSELGFLQHEIQILKDEISDFNSVPLFSQKDETESLEYFFDNAASLMQERSCKNKNKRLEDIKNILKESRLAAAYLNHAEKYNINIMISDQIEHAFYDRRSGTILIHSNLELNDQVLLLVRELRRHWQHRQGALINPLMFQPEHAVLINRAQEADLAVSIVRTAWELQLAGIRDVWERVENSPMADLARAFSMESYLDFRTINNGVACATVFEAWFLSERCRQKDKKIIQSMLADYNGYVFENTHSSKTVTVDLISALGSMPFGKNYLAVHADIIIDDPIFTELRDRSNANFLWFIKFERSFKQTEQELQTESDLSTHDIRHDLLNAKSQDKEYDHKQTADVIQLFEYQPKDGKTERRKSLLSKAGAKQINKKGADIIDLKRWSGK